MLRKIPIHIQQTQRRRKDIVRQQGSHYAAYFSYTLIQIHFLSFFSHSSSFSFSNGFEGNSINCAIQSNHSFAKCARTLQVLELTDALAVNSTAVRLEWHLLLSDTEYYIEVIWWNNLIDFVIKTSSTFICVNNFFPFKFNRACTFATVTSAAMLRSIVA